MALITVYRNRSISQADIVFIKDLIAERPDGSRRGLSQKICRAWNWTQPNGNLKDMVCRGMLLKLEREGHLILPPRKCKPLNPLAKRKTPRKINIDQSEIANSIKELGKIDLKQVRRTEYEDLFNSLIEQYHYLGYTQPVGEHLKYIAFANARPIGCLAFSSGPYQIGIRDSFIGWSKQARHEKRHLLAYNTRFLLLPWVKVKFLASHLLAKNSRIVSQDWQRIYNHPIYWLETFVDTERFRGICYQAANWQFIGYTKGIGKDNRTQTPNRSIKAMYGYPLVPDYRERLCGYES